MAFTKGLCFFILSLFLITNGIDGKQTKNLDDQKQLKYSEKPYVKTIKTEYGDIYDCIDFYKQPAFDHPLLKNHSFYPQMKPRFEAIRWTTNSNIPAFDMETPKLGLKDGGCPSGSVPIRRMSDEDKLQANKLAQTYFASTVNVDPLFGRPEHGTHYAVAQSKTGPGLRYYHGAAANISAYNPPTEGSQYSSGQIMIQDGIESLHAGWMVNRALYINDSRTRMFIYTNTPKKQCFNMLCSGFVLVKKDLPVDSLLHSSILGGPTYVYPFYITQDKTSGNWWLLVGRYYAQVGFWPQKIFSGLSKGASYIACGGGAYSGPAMQTPPMGSGSFPISEPKYDAFCAGFIAVNYRFRFVNINTEEFSDSDGYKVVDKGLQRSFGHLIYFGGPGGRPSI